MDEKIDYDEIFDAFERICIRQAAQIASMQARIAELERILEDYEIYLDYQENPTPSETI